MRVVGQWPEHHHQAPDQLDAGCAEPFGDLEKQLFALRALQRGAAHLHQLMRGQGAIDFLQYRLGEAIGSEEHDRVQVMRFGFQAQPLVAGQREFAHTPLHPTR